MSTWGDFNWGTVQWSDNTDSLAPVIEKLEYIDARGNVTDLSTVMDVQYKEGVDGRFCPPFDHLSEQTPDRDGAAYRNTVTQPRQLIVPLVYVADSITDIRITLRQMAQRINPKRGVGKLRVVTQDGLDRYINCIYEKGMESDTDLGGNGWWVRVAYAFRAFDPFWYNVNSVVRDIEIDADEDSTFFPTPPFRLGSSTIFASFDQTNNGDVEAWPQWVITGPGDNIRLINETTTKTLSLGNYSIPDGGHVFIDTRPGSKSITDSNGNNLFPYRTGSLWPLLDGINQITVEMLNSSDDSGLKLQYEERFLGV